MNIQHHSLKMESNTGYPPELIYSLLEKVQTKEPLWNPKHKDYKLKTLKRSLMAKISNELQLEFPYVENLTEGNLLLKFQYLRSHYQKAWRKLQKLPSDSGSQPVIKWKYFEACSFLNPEHTLDNSLNFNDDTKFFTEKDWTTGEFSQGGVQIHLHTNTDVRCGTQAASPVEASPSSSPEDSDLDNNQEEGTLTAIPVGPFPTPSTELDTCRRQLFSKKRKTKDDDTDINKKKLESRANAQEVWNSTEQRHPLADTVNSFMKCLLKYHPEMEAEFTQKVIALMGEAIRGGK